MTLITLAEFRRLTHISDSSLIKLLESNQLPCTHDHGRGILIDIESLPVQELANKISTLHQQIIKEDGDLLEEKIARIVSEFFGEILDDAIEDLTIKP